MKLNKYHIHARAADMDTAGLSMTGSVVPEKSVLSNAIANTIHFSPRFILPLLSCAVPSLVFASPEGGQVVAGAAAISNPDSNTTVITQTTTHTAIDWQRFDIGTQEYVQFVQPDASSVALNRVIGGDPSQILGNLSANGQVFLVNPNGIYFGQSATVDVGGIVASVHDIRNEDFLSGNYVFSKSDGGLADAGVVNDGVITARDGGYVVLMGDYVHNNGIISARLGTVALAAGKQITMDVKANGLVSVVVDEASLSDVAGVNNAGEIMAAGGRVMMTAKVANDLIDTAINNEGLVVAGGIAERNGVIFLTAAGGDIVNSGTLDASAEDGSNADGGGVLVYSDKNVINASGAEIHATGDGSGNGGVVRVIAEEFMGHQSGALIDVTSDTGKGGFVEVSGHGSLTIRGDIELGTGGELLIDPGVLTITNNNNTPGFTTGGTSPSFTNGSVGKGFIETQLDGNANVTLVANNNIKTGNGSGSTSFTISATGNGNLSILNGTVGTGGTFGACSLTGVCIPGGGTNSVTQGATGNVSLGNLSININGSLNIAGGSTAGNVSIGGINAAGNVSITAGNNINLSGNVSGAGTSFKASAGNDILVNGGIGLSGASLNAKVVLNADNNVDINSDIFLANNGLVLAANKDNVGSGDVNIIGTFGAPRTVSTQGNLNVSGVNFNVKGATAPSFSFSAVDSQLNVQANNIDVSITGNMGVSGGTFPPTSAASSGTALVSVSVKAATDIIINAASLAVQGGKADGSTSFGGNILNVDANATLEAGRDVSLTLTSNLNVQGGTANATALDSSASVHVKADASIIAGRNVLINNVGTNLAVIGGNALATRANAFSASCFNGCSVTANANAEISAGTGDVVITSVGNNLDVIGGLATANGSTFSMTYVGTFANVAANAGAQVSGNLITINTVGGSLTVKGGTGSAYASHSVSTGATPVIETATANADASMVATQNIQITNISGNLSVSGGVATAGATSSCSGTCTASATARADLSAGQALTVTTIGGNLNISGGTANAVAGLGATNAHANAFVNAAVAAGTSIDLNIAGALNVGGGNALANASGTDTAVSEANAEVLAGGNLTVTAADVSLNGGTAATSGTGVVAASAKAKLTANSAMSVIASNSIVGLSADVSAAGMYMAAGSDINLLTSNISVGNGTVAGITGDALTLAFMAANGIKLPTTANPNAKFSAGGSLMLGTVTMDGDVPYLWLEADNTELGGLTLPVASDVVVQYSPFTKTASIGVEDVPDASQIVNYNNLLHFGILPGTTIIIGSGLQTGEINIGNLGNLDIGAKNIVFVTASKISTIDNVISTGIVAELIVGQFENEFVTPVLTEVDIGLYPADDPSEEKEKKKKLIKDDEAELKMCEAG